MPRRPSRRGGRRARDPARHLAAFQDAASRADWDGALAALDALLALVPANAALHYNRAVALRRARRPHEALAAADAALRLDPSHPNAPFERAAALMDAARLEEAAAAFAAIVAADPHDADARHNGARCHLALGAPAAALAALPDAPSAAAEARAIRAEALRDLGRLDEAEALFATLPPAQALKLRTHGAVGRLPLDPRALRPAGTVERDETARARSDQVGST